MVAEERTTTVVHREWTLKAPAHHSDLQAALSRAEQERQRLIREGEVRPSDLEIYSEDDELIIVGFSYRQFG